MLLKVYPKKDSIFLIADSIVPSATGKTTIIGAYAAGEILLAPGSSFPATIPLGVYMVFQDGEGSFKAKIRILEPDDKSIIGDVLIGDALKLAGQPLQLNVNINLFQFGRAGTYKVQVLLDDHVYSNEISIRVSEKPLVAGV
jgi:hypothetical protein